MFLLTGCFEQLWQRWHGPDLPGVLPEEEVPLALLRRVHPVGGVEHQGQRRQPRHRAGETDLQGEGGREAGREGDQRRRGHKPPRVPAKDAHPVRGGQRVRHQSQRRPAVPLQDHIPDH